MRSYNFSPDAVILPQAVEEAIQQVVADYQGSGLSLWELGQKSPRFCALKEETEAVLRRVLGIPEEYEILFLPGGRSMQYAQLPLNLMRNSRADYLISGQQAKLAQKEADRFGEARIVASGEENGFCCLPEVTRAMFDPSADYVHIVMDNVCHGTTYINHLPDIGDVPIVADFSNCLLYGPLDISRYGLIYADMQGLFGASGMTLMILRRDLVRKEPPSSLPTVLSYKRLLEGAVTHTSLSTSGVYLCKCILELIEQEGGLAAIGRRNQEKSARLYDLLDSSRFYQVMADPSCRSGSSVVFRLPDERLTQLFLQQARGLHLIGLENSSGDGSLCACICNGIAEDGVVQLIDFMGRFQRENR